MPVGTKGTIKGLSSHQMVEEEALNPEIILGNTYHLAYQPGTPLVAEMGGLHKFMNRPNWLLTDSGRFPRALRPHPPQAHPAKAPPPRPSDFFAQVPLMRGLS